MRSGAQAQSAPPNTPAASAGPSLPGGGGERKPDLTPPEGFTLPALMVGDAAPPISVDRWLAGERLTVGAQVPREQQRVIVVEFWALWCGPCLANMPHLSRLQNDWGKDGLAIVGITGPERNNAIDDVERYLSLNAERAAFSIGWDDQRATYRAFMIAAGQKAIPCSFVIDRDGRLAWIGHPSKLEAPLRAVLDDKWDLAAARAAYKRQLIARARGLDLLSEYRKAAQDKDWEQTVRLADRLVVLDAEQFAIWKANAFGSILIELRDPDRALAYAQAMLADDSPINKSEEMLERLASLVADAVDAAGAPGAPAKPLNPEILDLGLHAADQAVELAGFNMVTGRTLARVQWARGDKPVAIGTLKRLLQSEKSDFRRQVIEKMIQSWESSLPSPATEPGKP